MLEWYERLVSRKLLALFWHNWTYCIVPWNAVTASCGMPQHNVLQTVQKANEAKRGNDGWEGASLGRMQIM